MFLHFDKETGLKSTTLKDRVLFIGNSISALYAKKADAVLSENNFDKENFCFTDPSRLPKAVTSPKLGEQLKAEDVKEEADSYNEKRNDSEKVQFQDALPVIESSADDCLYISIDDIGVKMQKESRAANYEKKRKYV